MEEEMNYFENIEGLLEPSEDNIENIERKTEKSVIDDSISILDEDTVDTKDGIVKLADLTEEQIIELAHVRIETFQFLAMLKDFGDDVSEEFKIATKAFLKYLSYISDANKRENILELANAEFRKAGLEEIKFNGPIKKSKENVDEVLQKIPELSDEELVSGVFHQLEQLRCLLPLKQVDDFSDTINKFTTRINTYLTYIKDENVKREVLTTMRNLLNNEKELNTTSSRSK